MIKNILKSKVSNKSNIQFIDFLISFIVCLVCKCCCKREILYIIKFCMLVFDNKSTSYEKLFSSIKFESHFAKGHVYVLLLQSALTQQYYNMNMCGMSDQYSYLIFAMCNMTGLRPIILA